jgi:hypothetical protein
MVGQKIILNNSRENILVPVIGPCSVQKETGRRVLLGHIKGKTLFLLHECQCELNYPHSVTSLSGRIMDPDLRGSDICVRIRNDRYRFCSNQGPVPDQKWAQCQKLFCLLVITFR